MKFHAGHVASSDSAHAFKKVSKERGILHASVIHKKKNWSHVVRIPVKHLSKRIRKRVAKLPTTTKHKYRMKAGEQMAEAAFSVVKRNIVLMNLKGRSQTASLNFLSVSWLVKHPGFNGVAQAIQIYQDAIRDKCDPKLAFKSTDWMRSLETIKQ